MHSPLFTMSLVFLSFFLALPFITQAAVPSNGTFKFVNQGEFGPYIVEYGADYRTLSLFSSPFQFCFYNTTPNAFTLALRMGTVRSESLMRWVWEANRGNPVRENATFSFGTNGNLVLAEANGKIAWQSNTANKGVVGYKLLSNGNLVLLDKNGKFIWQSFDYPTDTLLVGQSLRVGGPTKLTSRVSDTVNSNGPYSLVLEPKGLALYYQTSNSPKPYLYFSYADRFSITQGSLKAVTLNCSPETDEGFAYDLTFELELANSTNGGKFFLSRPKYNSTLTYLRLGLDGNVKMFTFYPNVDYMAWENTYSLFLKDLRGDECQLPERCGNFGLCEDSQCVACPTPKGLTGWSKTCAAPKLTSCAKNAFSYYKIEGVDHFLSKNTKGEGIKENECLNKCTNNCKCVGYFYNQATSRCWAVNDLKTLTKVANSTHVGYIKTPIA